MVLRTVVFPQEEHTTTTTTNISSTLSLYSRLSGHSKKSNNNSGNSTTRSDRGVFVGSVKIDALRNAIYGAYCMSVYRHPHTPKWSQHRIEYTLLESRSVNALPLRQLLQQQQPQHTQPPPSRDASVEEGAGLAKLVSSSIEGLMFDPLPSIAGKAVFDTPNNISTGNRRKRTSTTPPLIEFVVSVHFSGAPSSTSNSSASMIGDATSRLSLLLRQQSQSSELTTESVLSRLEKEEGQYSKLIEKALQSRVKSNRRSAASSSTHDGSTTSIEEELGRSLPKSS